MNVLHYFLGTRRKQWRIIILCLALTIVGYTYWVVHLWFTPGTGNGRRSRPQYFIQRAEKERNSTKLRNYLFRIRSPIKPRSFSPKNAKILNLQLESTPHLNNRRTTAFMTSQAAQANDISATQLSKTKPVLEPSLLYNVSYNVHIFYYPWYGNPSFDGKYVHWNHQYLPHWQPDIARKYRKGVHVPPDDIGSDFYPELGCYSSNDPNTIKEHFRQIRTSGAGVVVVSWYPKGKADGQGIPFDKLIPKLLDIAEQFKLMVTLQIEPYKGRNEQTVRDDVVYIVKKYSGHPAFYKYKTNNNRYLPLLYVYDSYHTMPEQWANLLKVDGSNTIRNTPYDCVMIALMVKSTHRQYVEVGGFDGFYTYFAVDGFTYGSKWQTWSNLKAFSKQSDSIFIPSVGPGYIDTSIRPWNFANTRSRQNGDYYKRSFQAALSVNPALISITSFNEWHEGTQIEKAVPKSRFAFKYQDYLPQTSDYYLKLTRKYVEMFEKAG